MAIYTATNTYLLLGTLNVSDHVQSASVTINYDMLDASVMTNAAHPQVKGLAAHTLQATLFNDQALSNIRAVLDAAKGTAIAFALGANGSTASATNPVYSGSIWINGYTPVNGSIGELATVDLSFDLTTDVTITVV
jgi:hypothetical protein